jgi:hypothetical protein
VHSAKKTFGCHYMQVFARAGPYQRLTWTRKSMLGCFTSSPEKHEARLPYNKDSDVFMPQVSWLRASFLLFQHAVTDSLVVSAPRQAL